MPSVARMKLTNLCLTNLGFKFCPICLGSLFARWLIGCNVALRPMQMCCWSRYTQEFAACLSLRLVPSTNCEIRSCTKHTFQSTSRFDPYWEHLQEAFELIIQYLAMFCCGIIINPKSIFLGSCFLACCKSPPYLCLYFRYHFYLDYWVRVASEVNKHMHPLLISIWLRALAPDDCSC